MPDHEYRPGQLHMGQSVERTLNDDGVLLVEAGTGTGKTLAYLVPAILSEKRVVISTGTKALQDQIIQRDIPRLRDHTGLQFEAAVMKGLENYLCLRRAEEFAMSSKPAEPAHRRYLTPLAQWQNDTSSGDRAQAHGIPETASLWNHVLSSSETRLGARCPHYDACFVTRMRQKAQAAQIIVVNHHLFFADLAARRSNFGSVIPEYDAVVLDEAHEIEDVATQFFGIRISTRQLEHLSRDVHALAVGVPIDVVRAAQSHVARASDLFSTLLGQLPTPATSRVSGPSTSSDGSPSVPRLEIQPEHLTASVQSTAHELDHVLEQLGATLQSTARKDERAAHLKRRTSRMRNHLAQFAEPPHHEASTHSHVRWRERKGRQDIIGASPVDAGAVLREHLFLSTPAVVLTSATLTTTRSKGEPSFDFLRQRTGLNEMETVEEAVVESPFDYGQQSALYLAHDLPDPRAGNYPALAAERICELVALVGGGVFVLCTSLQMMRELHKRCTSPEQAHPITQPTLLQGQSGKQATLEMFRTQRNAVLFATSGFWQGIDVPGDALRMVIIDKLPFEVPTDPLVRARCARLEEQGESPFMRYLVPSAALTLKQGFGRLIRTQKDRGIVALLDSRITTKGYGKTFLRSLPPAQQLKSLETLKDFWNKPKGQQKPPKEPSTKGSGPHP